MARNRGRRAGGVTQRRSTDVELAATVTQRLAGELVPAVAAEVLKALAPTVKQIPNAGRDYSSTGATTGRATPLTPGGWTDPLVAFGPGKPFIPAPIDPLEATGRPRPRQTEYPVSFNSPGGGDRDIPWSVLRQLADGVGVMRKCIEIRKSEMVQLAWDFVVDESVFEQAMLESAGSRSTQATAKAAADGDPDAKEDLKKRNGVSQHEVESRFRAENAAHIARLRQWWKKPDRVNNWTFEQWINAVMEEYLVLDALSLYPRKTLGGDLHSLQVIDGTTIKPLLDHSGSTPQPPNPAYQQILHGFPRGEFTASPGPEGEYDADTLLYRPRNVRSFTPYGFGPTEQAITDADLYLKRRAWMNSEYDDGVAPELLVKVDAAMTPEQLRAYERVFNDLLSGNTAERHRARFLPSGFDPVLLPSLEERYRADYDLHLIRLIGLAYDVMPTEMGFPPMGGLGGKGMSDGEENSQYRKSIRPTSAWLAGIIGEVSTTWLGMPDGLKFQFLGLEAEDEAAAMTVMEGLARIGAMTVNEMRDKKGLPRYDVAEADMPLIITQRDVIPLEGAVDRAAAAAAPKPAPTPPGQEPGQEGEGKPGEQPSGSTGQEKPGASQKPADGKTQPGSQGGAAGSGSGAGKPAPQASAGKAAGPDGVCPDCGGTTRDLDGLTANCRTCGGTGEAPADGVAAKDAEADAFRTFVRRIRKGDRPFRPFTFDHHPGYVADAANELAAAGEYAAAVAVLDVVVP